MWLVYSILATTASTTRSLLSKKVVTDVNEYAGLWTFILFGFLVSVVYLVYSGFTISNPSFWYVIALRLVIDSFAVIAYYKALKIEEVTFISPLLALSPILIAIFSYFINNQIPTPVALWGMALIVLGAIILMVGKIDFRNFRSNRQLFRSAAYIGITLVLWSLASAIHKVGISASSPATYFFVSYLGFVIIFTLLALKICPQDMKKALNPKYRKINVANGLALGLDQTFTLTAIGLGVVAYVEAIKSSSLMFTTLLAFIFLNEKVTWMKIFSIIIIFVGLLCIILGG